MTTRDAPAFDFYPERWLVGVASFSDAEQLAYLRLLSHQWLLGDAGLPEDMAALRRLAGKGVTPALLEKFPLGADGRRRNARLETIRAEQRGRIAKRREGAVKTNVKRWGNGVAGESLSDRSATRPRPPGDIADDSPPPTTHPSPPTTGSTDPDGGRQGSIVDPGREAPVSPPGQETVRQWADAVMTPPECADIFWNDHEARGWSDKTGQRVSNYRAAFNAFAARWKSVQAERDAKRRAPASMRSDAANQAGRYA